VNGKIIMDKNKFLKIIITTLISFFISTALVGEEKKDTAMLCSEPDSLTPSSAEIFIKVTKISKVIDFINSRKDSYNLGNLLIKNVNWIKVLKDKTKIDILNLKTLKDIGIDIDKALYMTSLGYEKNEPDSIIFLPVTDKKNFPSNFIKFLKIINEDNNNPDLNPAISTYKDTRVFQIPNKIFFAVIDDHFVLTSSGKLLTNIIDMKINGCDSALSMNPIYKAYKSKSETSNDSNLINVFFKKEFLDNKYKAAEPKDAGKGIQAKKANLNFINYISLSLDNETDDLSLRGVVSINKNDPTGDLLLNVMTTGLFENGLFADNPAGYHFLSIDINRINEYFSTMTDKNDSAYKAYAGIMNPDSKMNFLKDAVLPCSKSFINIIFKKPGTAGEIDNFIVYIPMKECGDIKKTLKNFKNQTEKNHPEEGTFGEEKIDGHDSFWFKNGSNSKIYILEYKGNLYAGNDVEFIKSVLDLPDKNSMDIKNDFIKRIDKNTFLVSYTQFDDESFIKAILMMVAYNNNSDLYQFIRKTGSIYLTGKKIDNDLIFNLGLKMLHNNK
jgi:hypothetical protein